MLCGPAIDGYIGETGVRSVPETWDYFVRFLFELSTTTPRRRMVFPVGEPCIYQRRVLTRANSILAVKKRCTRNGSHLHGVLMAWIFGLSWEYTALARSTQAESICLICDFWAQRWSIVLSFPMACCGTGCPSKITTEILNVRRASGKNPK
jgi:hypothetical protein